MGDLEPTSPAATPTVTAVGETRQYGSIVWKQDKKFGRHFGVDFTNPDFVALAEAFGIPGFRCEAVEDFREHLDRCLTLDEPSILVAPIDYSIDIALQEQLGTETVAA